MMETTQQSEQDEAEIELLKEWLPKISGENRAYLKGASEALLYAQEGMADRFAGINDKVSS